MRSLLNVLPSHAAARPCAVRATLKADRQCSCNASDLLVCRPQRCAHVCAGKDVVGLAQTGSGKTATFAIPIIQALLANVQPFFALVLSPTRELAIQICEQFEALGAGVGLKAVALVGGIDMMRQAVALGKRPHVIVGSPGRVVDHISNTKGFSLKVRAARRCWWWVVLTLGADEEL
jgi:hypothetical protein